MARTRQRAFLPKAVKRLQRRAEDVAMLIREAFLRRISTRQVGRVIGMVTGEVVSAQTVSTISRSLDGMVKAFHQAELGDDWVYLFLDGVSLLVRRPGGPTTQADRHRWLCGASSGPTDHLPTGSASTLLGAQDA